MAANHIEKQSSKEDRQSSGQELKEDEYSYFNTLVKNVKNVQGEEKASLLENFFSEFTKETSHRFVCNQALSLMLDTMLPQASVSSVLHLISCLKENTRVLCTDRFASHVMQTVLEVAFRFSQKSVVEVVFDDDGKECEQPVSKEDRHTLQDFILKISKFCYNNLHEFVVEPYASHIVRTLLEGLSGVEVPSMVRSGKRARTSHALKQRKHTAGPPSEPPQRFQDMLVDVTKRLMQVPNVSCIISSECGSAVYQCALQVLKPHHNVECCQPLAAHLLTHGLSQLTSAPDTRNYNQDNEEEQDYSEQYGDGGSGGDAGDYQSLHPMFHSQAAVRLLEVVIECSDSAQQSAILKDYFISNMAALVRHGNANFAVQKLVGSWKDADTFESVSEALRGAVTAAVSSRHCGVLLAWLQGCRRLGRDQRSAEQSLYEAFSCAEPEDRQKYIAPLLLHLLSYDRYQELSGSGKLPPFTLHGALIMQEVLAFKKPIKFVESLLQLPPPALLLLACDPRGCHVIDAFCNSPNVGEKSRTRLVHALKGESVKLACSKHGSRSLEVLWSAARTTTRAEICQQLSDNAAQIKRTQYGSILYLKFNVRLFSKTNKDEWTKVVETKNMKRKKLDTFMEEIERGSGPVSEKKQKTLEEVK